MPSAPPLLKARVGVAPLAALNLDQDQSILVGDSMMIIILIKEGGPLQYIFHSRVRSRAIVAVKVISIDKKIKTIEYPSRPYPSGYSTGSWQRSS